MLYEITHIRQSTRPEKKRWFTSADMDLFVWFRNGMPIHFQLYFDKLDDEKVICWHIDNGFTNYHVNNGESIPGNYKQSPLLKTSFARLRLRVIARNFLAACEHIDTGLADFIYARLMEIPSYYGFDHRDQTDHRPSR